MGSLRANPLSWKDLERLAPRRPDLVNGPTNPQARLRLFGQDEATVRVQTGDAARIQEIIDRARAAGMTIRSVRHVRPTLEDVFLEAVADRAPEGSP